MQAAGAGVGAFPFAARPPRAAARSGPGRPRARRAAGAALALLAAPAGAQPSSGGEGCPFYCRNSCRVAHCSRLQCNPYDPADCPGSECARECGQTGVGRADGRADCPGSECARECGQTGVLGSEAGQETDTPLVFGAIAGGLVLACCAAVLCYWCYYVRSPVRGHTFGPGSHQDIRSEWKSRQQAKSQKRAQHSKELEVVGKTLSAKEIVDKAMSESGLKDASTAPGPGSPRSRATSPTGSARGSPRGSPRNRATSPAGSATGSPRGGSSADTLKLPANRAFLRQIYEDRAAAKDNEGQAADVEAGEADGRKSRRTRKTARSSSPPEDVSRV